PHLRPWLRRAAVAGFVLAGVVAVGVVTVPPALRVAADVVDDDFGGPRGGLPALDDRSTVVAADGTVLAAFDGRVKRRVVPLSEIPVHVRDLVVVAEDRSFWRHDGYDAKAVARSLLVNVRAGEVVQGGSTISQQLAKLNFTDGERTWWRKVKEMVLAVAMEERFTKDQLLERYLNQVYFGAGAHGVDAAARSFFNVGSEELTVAQGALLAAVIPSPTALDPRSNPSGARARRDLILDAAHDAGYLSETEAVAAQREPLDLSPPPSPEPPDPFLATIKRELTDDPALGDTPAERQERILRGGLRIESTIDPWLQEIATEVVAAHLPNEAPTAAVAAVDPATGAVRALFGGTAQSFDLAAQGRRQPGSTFKPLVAAAALRAGIPPERQLEGNGPLELSAPGLSGTWEVDNAGHADYGTIDMAAAMAESVNTAFAELTLAVGVGSVVDVLRDGGIDVEAALGAPDEHTPAVGLGGVRHGVTPLEMAGAYAAMANAGAHHPPHIVERVTDAADETLLLQRQPMHEVLPPRLNARLLSMLQTAVDEGTGSVARLEGWSPAGKTGTSQDNADAWFVGTVPVLSTAVWVGDPARRRPLPGVTGANTAAPIWRDFMRRALSEREPEPFTSSPRL
ncbi:MAG: transglycosylase domain-containing protein, partial [Actinomycetota bacterium]|nr:transglycosylase domain-containing protein [Actinomycetota bacterium]